MKTFAIIAAAIASLCLACAPEERSPGGRLASGGASIGDTLAYDPGAQVNRGEKISLSFWTQVDQEAIYRELVDDYSALHPNVSIELVSSYYNDHFNKLHIALQSGIGPDLFHLHNSYADTLIPYMEPYPEAVLPRAALEAEFRQVASHVRAGNIYFIDTGLMSSCIYYNRAMWRAAGLGPQDIPKTWDELRDRARRLTRYEAGRLVRAGFNPNGIGFALFAAMNLQRGQSLFSAIDPKRPLVDTAASRASMAFLRSLYRDEPVADIHSPEFHESLGMGSAAMIYAWGWTNNWLRNNYPDLDFGVFPLPTWDGAEAPAYDRNNGESSMGVNRSSSEAKRAVAFDLLRFYLASDKYLARMSLRFGVAPSKRSLDDHEALREDPLLATFRQTLDRTVWPGSLPSFYEATLAEQLIDPVIIDGADVAGALAAAEARLIPLFRASGFVSLESQYRHFDELRFDEANALLK